MLNILKSLNAISNKGDLNAYYKTNVDPIMRLVPLVKYDKQCFLVDLKDANTRSAEECRSALERLTMIDDITLSYRCDMIIKLKPFVRPLVEKRRLYKLPNISLPFYNVTNPYIMVDPSTSNSYIINARHVNYHCNEQNEYHCNDPSEKIVHTKNVLYYMKDLNAAPDKTVLLSDHTQYVKYPSPVMDLEDIRLFVRNNGSIWCTATSRECLPSTKPQIMLCSVHPDKGEVSHGLRLLSPVSTDINETQKNWLPFIDDNDGMLSCIYSSGNKMLICAVDDVTGQCMVKYMYDTNLSFQQVRGGSPPCRFLHRSIPNVRYIYFVHYTHDQPNKRREYYHRIIYLGDKYKPLYISDTFTLLDTPGIEFVISCCPCVHDSSSVMIGFGVNDVQAYILQVSIEDIATLNKTMIE